MRYEEIQGNGKLIMDQLIKTHGPTVAFRLYGVLEYARLYPDLDLREPKALWADVDLLKKAGLYPALLKPAQLGVWARLLFQVNLKVALVVAKIVPIKDLVGDVTETELAAAREILRAYGLTQFDEMAHPAWNKPPSE